MVACYFFPLCSPQPWVMQPALTFRELFNATIWGEGKMKIKTLCSVWPPFPTLKLDKGFPERA
jgi:hypothetical protein